MCNIQGHFKVFISKILVKHLALRLDTTLAGQNIHIEAQTAWHIQFVKKQGIRLFCHNSLLLFLLFPVCLLNYQIVPLKIVIVIPCLQNYNKIVRNGNLQCGIKQTLCRIYEDNQWQRGEWKCYPLLFWTLFASIEII